jgi:hypothetical protein
MDFRAKGDVILASLFDPLAPLFRQAGSANLQMNGFRASRCEV